MTKMKFMAAALSVLMLLPSCGTATKNGALIGGASLKAEDFIKLVAAAVK